MIREWLAYVLFWTGLAGIVSVVLVHLAIDVARWTVMLWYWLTLHATWTETIIFYSIAAVVGAIFLRFEKESSGE